LTISDLDGIKVAFLKNNILRPTKAKDLCFFNIHFEETFLPSRWMNKRKLFLCSLCVCCKPEL